MSRALHMIAGALVTLSGAVTFAGGIIGYSICFAGGARTYAGPAMTGLVGGVLLAAFGILIMFWSMTARSMNEFNKEQP